MKRLEIRTLDKGWRDVCEVMLHASFQLLVDYVEKERPDEHIDWNGSPDQKQAWREIKALYRWWTVIRPIRKDPIDAKGLKIPPIRFKKIPDSNCSEWLPYDKEKYADYHNACIESNRLEDKWSKQDQKNLHRLIEVREYMWT